MSLLHADAAADGDVDEEEGEEADAEDENIAAAQGHAAIQAASEAAADGITGSTSAQHMIELLLQLPDSQRSAEDAAAASGKGRQQNDKWSKLNEQLSKVVLDAAAGKMVQYRRGDDKYQQLHAELLQLQQELPLLDGMVLSNRTWEVSSRPVVCGYLLGFICRFSPFLGHFGVEGDKHCRAACIRALRGRVEGRQGCCAPVSDASVVLQGVWGRCGCGKGP